MRQVIQTLVHSRPTHAMNAWVRNNFPVSIKKTKAILSGEVEPGPGGASNIVKAEISGKDPTASGGFVSNHPHPWVNNTKQLPSVN